MRWNQSKRFSIVCLVLLVGISANGIVSAQTISSDSTNSDFEYKIPDIDSIQTLDLPIALAISLSQNPSLAATKDRIKQAEENLTQARSAWWPRLDASGSISRIDLAENDQSIAFVDNDPTDNYTASIIASWIVFNGFERERTIDSATIGVQQSESSLENARRLLISAVSTSFYNAQLALEDIAIARADEEFNKRQLVESQARFKAGAGSLSDVLNFEIRVNSAKTQLLSAQRIYDSTLFSLAALMGISDARFSKTVNLARLKPESPEEMAQTDVPAAIQYARKNRPDLLESQLAVDLAGKQVKIEQANYYPILSASASYDGDRRDDASFESDDFGNTIGIQLTYNLFSGGLHKSRISEAKVRQEELGKRYEDSLINVKASIRSAARLVNSAQEQLILQRKNTEIVERTRNLVEKEYAAGQGSLVRLNEAQRDLVTAQSRLSLALVSLRLAWLDLYTETSEILHRTDKELK